MTELNFDANNVEPATGRFELLPIDDYLAVITESAMADNKKTKGKHLSLTWTIVEGDYKDRKVFTNLNLINENPDTVEIAQRDLSAICRATGVLHPKDSAELHDKPVVISVGIRKGSNGYEDSNIIKKYSRTDGKELADVTDATVPAKGAPVIGGGTKAKKPWQR
jgi:Protein of unknown function (DUF669)